LNRSSAENSCVEVNEKPEKLTETEPDSQQIHRFWKNDCD
jgi:hypothetical protein